MIAFETSCTLVESGDLESGRGVGLCLKDQHGFIAELSGVPQAVIQAMPNMMHQNVRLVLHYTSSDLVTNIQSRLATMLEQHLFDDKPITKDTTLESDLQMDSLDRLEFLLAVEEEFEIELSDSELETIKTVGDAAALVAGKVGA